jgi:hypothetical protein
MLNFTEHSKQISAKIFLVIFIAFLLISFSHGHNFDIRLNSPYSINQTHDNLSPDIFITEHLNCIIHSFANSIKLDSNFDILESILRSKEIAKLVYNQFYYSPFNSTSNQLRAPPVEL